MEPFRDASSLSVAITGGDASLEVCESASFLTAFIAAWRSGCPVTCRVSEAIKGEEGASWAINIVSFVGWKGSGI